MLVLFGAFLGLLVGFVVLFLLMGWLNSMITDIVWHIPIKTNWTTVLVHGLVPSVAFIVVHVPSLVLNLVIPNVITVVSLLIVYAFIDGFIDRHIGILWQQKEVPP